MRARPPHHRRRREPYRWNFRKTRTPNDGETFAQYPLFINSRQRPGRKNAHEPVVGNIHRRDLLVAWKRKINFHVCTSSARANPKPPASRWGTIIFQSAAGALTGARSRGHTGPDADGKWQHCGASLLSTETTEDTESTELGNGGEKGSNKFTNTYWIETAVRICDLFHLLAIRCSIMKRTIRWAFNALTAGSIALLTCYSCMMAYDTTEVASHSFVGPSRTYSMWYWNGRGNFQSVRFFSEEHPNLRHITFMGEIGYPHEFLGCTYEEAFRKWGWAEHAEIPVFVRTLTVPVWMIILPLLLLPLAWVGNWFRHYRVRKSKRRGFPILPTGEKNSD